MYNYKEKRYIFTNTAKKTYTFYYDENLGLCYNTLNKYNSWNPPISLQKNIHPFFYIDMDFNDMFHIIFQDKHGNLYYSFMENSKISTVALLKSKFYAYYNKYPFLIKINSAVYFFFIIHHNDKLMLSYQLFSDNKVTTPKVIDYVPEVQIPYKAIYNNQNSIYIFYQNTCENFLQIGYKEYYLTTKKWTDYNPVTNQNSNAEFPRIILDNKNILHLIYQRKIDKQFDLVYKHKVSSKSIWSDEKVFCSSSSNFLNSSISLVNKILFAYWLRENNIYFRYSKDSGTNWSPTSKNSLSNKKHIFCAEYKTNNPSETKKTCAQEIPANYNNGFNIAFLNNYNDFEDGNISNKDSKKIDTDTFSTLKENIEDLKKNNHLLKEEIKSLKNSLKTMGIEITKNQVRISLLENKKHPH